MPANPSLERIATGWPRGTDNVRAVERRPPVAAAQLER
jgi:hypothetical protein